MRLFVALVPPPDLALALESGAREGLAALGGADLRLLPARDLHMTLVFLGELDEARVEPFRRALAEELRGMVAPDLRLSGAGGFPDQEDPFVLWAGVEEDDRGERLATLAGRAQQAARSFGWRPSAEERGRAFRPHVTLARRRPGARPFAWPAGLARALPARRWLPIDVALVCSRPDRPEQRYTTLAHVPLVVTPG